MLPQGTITELSPSPGRLERLPVCTRTATVVNLSCIIFRCLKIEITIFFLFSHMKFGQCKHFDLKKILILSLSTVEP